MFRFFIFILFSLSILANTENVAKTEDKLSLWEKIELDHKNYYQNSDYKEFGLVLLTGGIMANTNIDQCLRDYFQSNIRNHEGNEQAAFDKLFGEGKIMIPVAVLTGAFGAITDIDIVRNWGEGVSRAYLVGAPPMLLMQKLTGGSRPLEMDNASRWKLWQDENGVSGHAFMGAIPFLVASDLATNKYVSYALKGASVITALSRVNDDAHFTSQAIIGWYMGYMAVKSINKTDKFQNKNNLVVMPIASDNTYGLYFSFNK